MTWWSAVLDVILISVLSSVVVVGALICARREARERKPAPAIVQENLRKAS